MKIEELSPREGLEVNLHLVSRLDQDGVAEATFPFGNRALVVGRYAQVREVLTSTAFSRSQAAGPDVPRTTREVMTTGLINMDPPDNRHLRSMTLRHLSVERLQADLPVAVEQIARLISPLQEGQNLDVVSDVAVPFAGGVVQRLVGLPSLGAEDLWRVSSLGLSAAQEKQGMAIEAAGALWQDLSEMLEQSARNPRQDLVSELARRDHSGLSHDDAVLLLMTVLAAGTETTVRLLANCVFTMLSQRLDWAHFQGSLQSAVRAVDELLRFIPVERYGASPRRAVRDTTLDGVAVPEGAYVVPVLSFANRDARVFDKPNNVDLGRAPNPHLSFGLGGHLCVGHVLARYELAIAMQAFAGQGGLLEIDERQDSIVWVHDSLVRGLERLVVKRG